MELRHLRYFIAVAEAENVNRASATLHVTQPAVTRQIHELETELGFALFLRTGRGIKLSQAGQVFLIEARKIFGALDSACRLGRQAAQGLKGKLRISFVESVGWQGLVPTACGEFQALAPEVIFELTPAPSVVQLAALEKGEVDGGFLYLFDELPAHLCAVSLAVHNVMLAAPRTWKLPEDAAGVPASALAGRPFVTFHRHLQPQFHDRLLAACSAAGLTLDVVQETSTDAAVLSLVSAGIGAAILNAANDSRRPVLTQFLALADIAVPLHFAFVRRKEHHNPALGRFEETLGALLRLADAPCASASDPMH